jgi:hypothetical protein
MIFRYTWICAAALFVAASALNGQNIAGDWLGAIKAGPAELNIALHITKAADGSLKATMDSLDQGAKFPVDTIALAGTRLNLTVNAVQGSYEGTLNPQGSLITGTWSQGPGGLPLEFHRGVITPKAEPKPGKPTDIDGDWHGAIDSGKGGLEIIFHIMNTDEGLIAKADVPAQGATGIPVTKVTRNGASLILEMRQLGGGFDGTISKDLKIIDGTWTQMGNKIPLVLKR